MEILNEQFSKDIESGTPLNLELGGGTGKHKGYYNIDACNVPGVDALADLNKPLSLVPTDSVSRVISNHALEHIEELELLLSELHRVTKSDGTIEITVPHFSNPFYYSDPTHKRFFGLYTMCYFVDFEQQPFRRKRPTFYTQSRFRLVEVKIEFFRFTRADKIVGTFLSYLVNRSSSGQEFYERHLCWIFKAHQIRYKLAPVKK